MPASTGERFERAVSIMARLRGPGGCPWDREQTFDSIKPYTIEETYEVLEAIEQRDWSELAGELGDLLLQVLFYSQLASEQGSFSIDHVLDRLADKLIARHPHVFRNVRAETSAEVLRNWEAIKLEEKKKQREAAGPQPEQAESVLSGVSRAMPALLEAHKLGARAAGVGFDWPDTLALFEKLKEEAAELEAELEPGGERAPLPGSRCEEELGDLFFVLVNLARRLALDSESALRRSNRKFRRRFEWMENELRVEGRSMRETSPSELEALWQMAKLAERGAG
jgi:MazG family protein